MSDTEKTRVAKCMLALASGRYVVYHTQCIMCYTVSELELTKYDTEKKEQYAKQLYQQGWRSAFIQAISENGPFCPYCVENQRNNKQIHIFDGE